MQPVNLEVLAKHQRTADTVDWLLGKGHTCVLQRALGPVAERTIQPKPCSPKTAGREKAGTETRYGICSCAEYLMADGAKL